MEKLVRFNNDYNHGAHPAILKALADTNDTSFGGYGQDEVCEAAKEAIYKYIDCPEADIHFVVGGTQANILMIEAAITKKFESVICADSGHINSHETGSIENMGHKLLTLPHTNGKISAEQIAAEAEVFRSSPLQEHITEPRAVYISFPTEYGTIYSKKELVDISAVCKEYNMYLILDGARLGYGLASPSNDVTLADITRLTDAFYLGGTKCGALFGEAIVITDNQMKRGFRSIMKMNGALLAKGWLLGLQYKTLFEDGLYFEITQKAVDYAKPIEAAFKAKGVEAAFDGNTNQLFYIPSEAQIEELKKGFVFEVMDKVDDEHRMIRICTSWSTTYEEVEALVGAINNL